LAEFILTKLILAKLVFDQISLIFGQIVLILVNFILAELILTKLVLAKLVFDQIKLILAKVV